MPISWNEAKTRALGFSKEWIDAKKEASEKQTFWNEFFQVFGISRKRVATFEESVRKYEGEHGSIDLLYPGKLIVEHKSAGKNLDDAYQQAIEYAAGLPEKIAPTHIVVSDFAHFRVYDLEAPQEKRMHEFPLSDLVKHVKLFGFLMGYQTVEVKAEDPVNQKAVKAIAKLHDALKKSGYAGHQLEILLTRLVYCFFADDTGIFDELDSLQEYFEKRTNMDGSDMGPILTQIFQVLNQPMENRQNTLDEDLAKLPLIDGPLFKEHLDLPSFNSDMRRTLLECSAFDWGKVSPVIFGSMFQSVMDEKARHDLGAHYTSETNIFKVINSLFLDDLKAELEAAGNSKKKLAEFKQKLADLRFLDPACGCGNFLVVTYRELRRLELEALKRMNIVVDTNQRQATVLQFGTFSQVNVDQMFGIEIEEFPARVAELALWLTDHQMNMELSAEFGERFVRLPLKVHPNIHIANALRIDWNDVIPKEKVSYILGNPPFSGYSIMSKEQRSDLVQLFRDVHGAGVLDYVTGWYLRAAEYIQGTNIRVAFVSTNSITQGEQVGILWKHLIKTFGIYIQFAHRTFKWTNEAPGRAAVFCVIIGFSLLDDGKGRRLYEYENVAGEPHLVEAHNINPYLVDAPNVVLDKISKPLCDVPKMVKGSQPTDGGYLLLDDEEKKEVCKKDEIACKYIRPLLSAKEYLNGLRRWCFWLKDASPADLRTSPGLRDRLSKVVEFRQNSNKAVTRQLASMPALFAEIRQPNFDFILVPRVSSESRRFIPMSFFSKDMIVGDTCQSIPNATLYHFGVLQSTMHMAWVRQVCGRLKSDYRYSNKIVYNNFPWPQSPNAEHAAAVEKAAQGVLDTRTKHPGATLADLYDPNTMPPDLLKAHQALDKAVDRCYGTKKFDNETQRLEYLFGMYKELVEREGERVNKVKKPGRKRV